MRRAARAAVAARAAGGDAYGPTFFLAPSEGLAPEDLAPPALVCTASSDPRPFEAALGADGVARFSRLEAGDLTHGVVRTFCSWLNAA